jgi:uncharacterized membrane protein
MADSHSKIMTTISQNSTPSIPADPTASPVRTSRTVWLIAAVAVLVALIAFPYLPDPMPTHWGLSGAPNGWSPKWFGTFLMPGMIVLFAILFPVLQRIDPKREQYALFQKPWMAIQIALAAFFLFMEALMYYAALVPSHNDIVGTGVTAGIGVLFIVLGNYMGKIRQNWFIGLRTPWTLEDPEVWQKSQRLGGWMFVLGGIAILIISLTIRTPLALFITFMSVVLAISIVPIAYSYMLAQRKKK